MKKNPDIGWPNGDGCGTELDLGGGSGMCATLGSSDGSGHEERVGDARGNGIGWDYGDGDGRFCDGLGRTRGGGWGEGFGNGDGQGHGGGLSEVSFTENDSIFQPWTPEKILHAYAYLNASSQEKDSILGLVELIDGVQHGSRSMA